MDDSDSASTKSEDRYESLGFTPQKETVFNSHLPYAEHIDVESNAVLAEIKANLALSVQLRDLKKGTRHWTVQLERLELETHISVI